MRTFGIVPEVLDEYPFAVGFRGTINKRFENV